MSAVAKLARAGAPITERIGTDEVAGGRDGDSDVARNLGQQPHDHG
jgi:hypothetical protein